MTAEGGGGPEIPHRADIDGLRTVAVLSVVGFHAYPKLMPGGFIGVDMFFVISGYLITSLILRALKQDTFSFADFYVRRIRRLAPALTVVLLITLRIGWFSLSPSEYAALGRHTLASAAFAANVQIFSEVGYFDAPAATKPLLHLWPLGVEEQFYLIFPVLACLLFRNRKATLTLLLVGLASFALNIALVRTYPPFTFYLPFTRFWEFIVGALLAYGELRGRKRHPPEPSRLPWREIAAASGLGLICIGLCVTREAGFPGWRATLPVCGTALVIGARPSAWLNHRLLAIRPLVIIGLISYPLYLLTLATARAVTRCLAKRRNAARRFRIDQPDRWSDGRNRSARVRVGLAYLPIHRESCSRSPDNCHSEAGRSSIDSISGLRRGAWICDGAEQRLPRSLSARGASHADAT